MAENYSAEPPLTDNVISLSEVVYRRLRTDILNGDLLPGQLLRQEEVARQFAVSRVPLREAMARLESEGLLILRPRRGYAVTSLDPSEIVEIFELRAVIEEHAGEVAARARTQDDIEAVGALLDQMKRLDPKSPTLFSDWSRCNYEFHGRLIDATRRTWLARTARTLRDTVEPFIRIEARMTGQVHDADGEHDAIFDALRAGDARGLAKLSRKHVENTAERLLSGLRHAGHPYAGRRDTESRSERRAELEQTLARIATATRLAND
jgi:DNA-binding GntR family transcriptional regulator